MVTLGSIPMIGEEKLTLNIDIYDKDLKFINNILIEEKYYTTVAWWNKRDPLLGDAFRGYSTEKYSPYLYEKLIKKADYKIFQNIFNKDNISTNSHY